MGPPSKVGSAAVIAAGLFGFVAHMSSSATSAVSRSLLAGYRTLAAAPIKTAGAAAAAAAASEKRTAEALWEENGAVLVSVRRLG